MHWFWALAWVPVVFFVARRVRRRHHFMRHYWARRHGFRHADYGHHHPHGYGWGRRRSRHFLFGLFQELDATPGQEKAILKLVNSFSERLRETLPGLSAVRKELAAALGGDVLDTAALDAVFLRNTELFVKLSHELQKGLAEVHATLDSEQRQLLAQALADGSFHPRFGGFGGMRSSYAC